jgi:flagellar biogenesis protein FliO
MNQKSIFAKPIFPASVSASTPATIRLAIAVCLACAGVPLNTFAQGPPAVTPNRNVVAAGYHSWTPPGSAQMEGSPDAAVEPPPSQSPWSDNGFPEAPVAFDTRDGSTMNDPNPSGYSEPSLESTIDTTASMLSNLSDSVGEKTSGWLASLKQNGWMASIRSLFGASEAGKMLGSLALVLGIYFAFVWVMRKINPGGNRELPPEVVSVLGQVPFGPRQNLQLVRLGSKLLLLMNSPEGTQPIGEIADALEVEYLTSLCPGASQSSSGLGALHLAAKRLTESASQSNTTPQPTPTTNLSQVIKMLERATKQGGAVFEA